MLLAEDKIEKKHQKHQKLFSAITFVSARNQNQNKRKKKTENGCALTMSL